MTMKFCSLLTFLYLLLQTPFLSMADRQLIENTCKTTPLYHLCLSTLLADPWGLNADVSGLAIIVVNAVKTKSDEIISQTESLIKTHPELKESLMDCTTRYQAVVNADVPSAIQALKGGVYKFAESGMADAVVEAQSCKRNFGDHGQSSPLTDMNKAIEDLGNVAVAIIKTLL